MRNIILVLISLLLYYTGCGAKNIQLDNVVNRSKLDSIITLIPLDSIKIDSTSGQQLEIVIYGKFQWFDQTFSTVTFFTKNEKLDEMLVQSDKNYLSMLNSIEAKHGLNINGKWQFDNQEIFLEPNTHPWDRKIINDSISFSCKVKFRQQINNKITELYKNSKNTNEVVDLYLKKSRYAILDKLVYVNDIQVEWKKYKDAHPINHLLSTEGHQKIRCESTDQPNKTKELHRLKLLKKPRNSAKMKVEDIIIDPNKKTETFNIDFKPRYTLTYSKGADLRTQPLLKEKIYALYQKLQMIYEKKDESSLVELYYSFYKNKAIAYNWDKQTCQSEWQNELNSLHNNDGWVLLPIDELEVTYANNGKLACLTPKNTDLDGPFVVYHLNSTRSCLDYYVALSQNKQLYFAIHTSKYKRNEYED